MVEVKIGTMLKRDSLRSGKKKDGTPWLFSVIYSDKNYDKIQVWASNPEVGTGKDLTITSINQVKLTNRKYTDKNGEDKWGTEYLVEAKVEPINSSPVDGFSMITDESIPF